MLKVRKEKGLETTWKSAEEVFDWWINLQCIFSNKLVIIICVRYKT